MPEEHFLCKCEKCRVICNYILQLGIKFYRSKTCLPYLIQSQNPHILNLAPPLNMSPRWFANHTAYTIAKYGMSMCVLGMAEEFRGQGVAVNALWPRTIIHTAAVDMLRGSAGALYSRKPEIIADAAYAIFCRDSKEFTGNFFVDDEVLLDAGVKNFAKYACYPEYIHLLETDAFLDEKGPVAKL